jgi:hypothetical protein
VQQPPAEREAVDEWLSPALDILPIEYLAWEAAPRRGYGEGFRYIQKVVKRV